MKYFIVSKSASARECRTVIASVRQTGQCQTVIANVRQTRQCQTMIANVRQCRTVLALVGTVPDSASTRGGSAGQCCRAWHGYYGTIIYYKFV